MFTRPLYCLMAACDCRMLKAYLESVRMLTLSFMSVRTCVRVTSSAFCEEVPGGSKCASITPNLLTMEYPTFLCVVVLVELPPMNQVSAALGRWGHVYMGKEWELIEEPSYTYVGDMFQSLSLVRVTR